MLQYLFFFFFFFQAEDGIRDLTVTGVQTCALPISPGERSRVPHGVRNLVDGRDVSEQPLARYARSIRGRTASVLRGHHTRARRALSHLSATAVKRRLRRRVPAAIAFSTRNSK